MVAAAVNLSAGPLEHRSAMGAGSPVFARQTYRPSEVASMLGVSPRTIYRRVEDGSLPHLRIGVTVRIPIEEFHKLYPELRRPLQLMLPFRIA